MKGRTPGISEAPIGTGLLSQIGVLVVISLSGACGVAHEGVSDIHVLISGAPSCAECTVVFEETVTLGQLGDPASFGVENARTACTVGRLSSGGFVSSGLAGGGEIFVYDDQGAFAGAMGRRGEGPGEFGTRLSVIVDSGDTIFVVDRSQAKVTTISPSGDYMTSFSLPPRVFGFARLRDGGFVFHTLSPGVGAERPLLRRYDAAGQQLAAYEPPSRAMVRRKIADMDRRTVAASRTGDHWVAKYWTYEIHRQAASGKRDLTIIRDVDWFPPGDPGSVNEVMAWFEETPPPTSLRHLWETEDGLLWTYSIVPDPTWEPETADVTEDLAWVRETWDTMVEVLDIHNGTVLASARHDEYLVPVCGSELVSTVRETPAGDARAVVLAPTLTR